MREASERVKDSCTEVFAIPNSKSLRASKMSKSKTSKKEKISVASEIDRIEERKLHCKNNLERAEFRQRKEELSDNDRLALDDEMTILNERIQKYENELQVLRGENRKNMMVSVALLAISALFYYTFIY
ncbi:coiled-coil domain-containing protein 167 [Garra rufa]|uniref:coiled-coil domain-containing protein 167 n=1 Tax=Garra rufa TaxID=137080 RepID=UPI003CCE702D